MEWFVIGAILLIGGLIAAFIGARGRKKAEYKSEQSMFSTVFIVGSAVAVVGVITTLASTIYQQDEGEVNVLRSISGEVVDQDLDAGFGFKAPWVETRTFDVRNQMVAYVGDGTSNYNGAPADGEQITANDADGVAIDFDLIVNYNVDSAKVTEIYRGFQTQEAFRDNYIEQHVRAQARLPFSQYTAQEAMASRGEIGKQIEDLLRAEWADKGVLITSVQIQDMRPPESVATSINEAQQARIAVERAEADLARAEVAAQTRVAEATAQAEANRILTESLSPEVLQQRYFDTLAEVGAGGNLVVVPEGFSGMLNLPAPTQ